MVDRSDYFKSFCRENLAISMGDLAAFRRLQKGERWYAVHTQPRREDVAFANLHRQGFRPFVPRLLRTVRHARRTRLARVPLFPGYLFVPLDLRCHRWRSVNGTVGVISLVMAGERPLPVPEGVVEALVHLTREDGVVDLAGGLRPGTPVRVLTGPFADLLAELVELDDRGRARVLIEIMGGVHELVLDRRMLTLAR